jgi:peptide/nickel transport system permease protein
VIYNAQWMIIFPGIVTALTVLGLNLFGDGLRDLLDPQNG